MTAQEIKSLLYERFCMPEWAAVEEVPNNILGSRRIDFLAMNMYPSKNNEILGFEIKVSRADLLRELKDFSKSDTIARHCDYFYLVVPKEIIKNGDEIPETWGIYEVSENKLRKLRKGLKINCSIDVNRGLVAAFLQAFFRERVKEIDKECRNYKEWLDNNNEKVIAEVIQNNLSKHSNEVDAIKKALMLAKIPGYITTDPKELAKMMKIIYTADTIYFDKLLREIEKINHLTLELKKSLRDMKDNNEL